jgi:hypothetical protein
MTLAGEHDHWLADRGWRMKRWKAAGGYARLSGDDDETQGRKNRFREVLWLSPHCLRAQEELAI